MASRWTKIEEKIYSKELINLYIKQNKSLREVAEILNIPESTVYQRLIRLGIKTQPRLKKFYQNQRGDVKLPNKYTMDLAEFFGVMLGDGHISHFQVIVSLGTKEEDYAFYVRDLIKKIFRTEVKIAYRSTGYRDIYLGSTIITSWLLKEGLVNNKVKSQVDIPEWIFSREKFMKRFLRGFFDTDGSVYKLKFGIQISLTNHSYPILLSLHKMLFKLRYNPSKVSAHKVYLTKANDLEKFFREIRPKNPKHVRRFEQFILMRRSDSGYSRRL